MSLNHLIATSYGSKSCIFAEHELDRQRALESLIAADTQDVGYAEFLELHRAYLVSKGCTDEHIELQLQRVQQIRFYCSGD